jgi:hypothetical protein
MITRQQAVKKVLDQLRSALGTGEEPPGSNHNFIVEWYNKMVAKIGNGPWCQMTQTWAFWTAGFKAIMPGESYTVWAAQHAQQGRDGSSWHFGTKGMRAGDRVYFAWDGSKGPDAIQKIDHTSTAEKINGNGTFYSLEGNIGDKMRRVLRDGKYVVGYVRPDWNKVSQEPRPKPSPKNDDEVKELQHLVEANDDGEWGPHTEDRARQMRAASRKHHGWPDSINGSYTVTRVQEILDVRQTGNWDGHTQDALIGWIKKLQKLVGAKPDGWWGKETEDRYQEFRRTHHKP